MTTSPAPTRVLYDLAAAAEALSMARSRVRELVNGGAIRATRIDNKIRISATALSEYVERMEIERPATKTAGPKSPAA